MASGLKGKETCRGGTEEACRRVKFTEAGKFGGALIGGAGGAAIGTLACVGIGFSTFGLGGIVCAVVLTGASTVALGEGCNDLRGFCVCR